MSEDLHLKLKHYNAKYTTLFIVFLIWVMSLAFVMIDIKKDIRMHIESLDKRIYRLEHR